jgi:PilZ domain
MSKTHENTVQSVNRPGLPSSERRVARRFVMSVPVLFRWKVDENEHRSGGFTRDVSTFGVYVVCEDECPELNAGVALEILLPRQDAQNVGLKLKSVGEVVRIERAGERKGFAVRTDFDNVPRSSD